ncbi:hypothetical protein PFISCL1PPCAC_21624 [Pristionchus fissidentatus]|uniref:Major facilitator superfamily (MFS) profile domain-containing protein n=1 Tax=Pristionchus fissidentatus TaxID=1538716 RepID=A0AAV5WKC5_9BILA|nr:hypothetical protein PFISCL1PPCAC_21624 [Pristionchus fissidentatus]
MGKMSDDPEEEEIVPPLFSFRSLRLRVVLLIAFAMTVQGLARGSFGMAAVCFVPNTNSTVPEKQSFIDDSYTVDWSVTALSRIHTSFYIGSFVSVLMVDRAVKRFGAKKVMAFGAVLSALGSMATPLVILYAPHNLFTAILRFIMGVGFAFVIPCGSVIISRWFPLFERSTGMAVFTTGNQLGTAIAMIFTAEMCELDLFGGWPLSFEAYGIVFWGFVALWLLEITNKPREHKSITAVELEYITGKTSAKARAVSVVMRTPYRKIFLSPAVLSICSCSFAQSFVVVALVTYLPKYYQQALHMDLNKNGFFSAAPFVVQIVTKLSFALVADNIKANCKVNLDGLAKAFNAVACFGSGLCILAIAFLGADQSTLIMLLMTASMGLFSGFVPGYNTSIVSVAPMFTATVSAYSQVFSQVGSAIAPFLIGLITQNGTIEEWRWVFYIITGILFTAGIIYQVFGKCTAEPWGDPSSASHRSSMAALRAASAANLMSSKMDLEDARPTIDVLVTEPTDSPRVATLRNAESAKSLLGIPRRTTKEVSFCEEPEVNEFPSMQELSEPISEEDDDEITVVTGVVS